MKSSTGTAKIVIATPHRRYDSIEDIVAASNVCQTFRLRNREDLNPDCLEKINPDYIFFPHWSWKIPKEIHERYECVIFHMTDLPFGRGGSPLQNLIARGVSGTKLSAIRCVEELDAGPVYLKLTLSLYGAAEEIYMRAGLMMAEMIIKIVEGNIRPVEQQGEPVFFRRRTPEEGNIENLKLLNQVYDYIRMLDAEGYPPAFIEAGHLRFEFSRASIKSDSVVADVRIILKSEKDTGK